MDRKSFLKLLPAIFAVKSIAKELAKLPAQPPVYEGSKGLYYQIRHGGNRVSYNAGQFDISTMKRAMADIFTD